MRKKSGITLGPGAPSLILIFVVLSLTVLGTLCLMTGRSDLRLSERSARVTEDVFALYARAERRRADIDSALLSGGEAWGSEAWQAEVAAALPPDVLLEDGEISWQETDGSRTLDCALAVLPEAEGGRTAWVRQSLTAETEDEWN